MVHIALNDDQWLQLASGDSPVLITDPQGRVVGRIARVSKGELSEQDLKDVEQARRNLEASKRDGRPAITTQELLAHLRSLAPE